MAVSGGKVLGGAATGAAAGSVLGPWGTAGGALVGGLLGALSGGDNEAPAPPPSQYGGNLMTNQFAAQQYAAGLQQQQAQNAREAALYGNANNNFDIANAAQLRQGPQISSALADKQRQLAALGGTNAAIGNINQTGAQLTALGTRPMGPSYAEAQLRQGQDAAMAQQLSMARSGRSLGSGQAAMNQAAFNNAALNQQTNLAAANARIQEQNAYNQFQAGALASAGQQYGAAGALSGQAGNQATTFRQGNEGVQLQNAQLQQAQQGINNQTTGLYNNLGAQQQQLGMQANQLGQQASQFGQQQASGIMGAQLSADTGRLSANTATNLANQQNANLHDAATANQVATAAGTIATMAANGNGEAPAAAPSNPNDAYRNISIASNAATANNVSDKYRSSDENQKKNIRPIGLTSPKTDEKYAEFSPAEAAAYKEADRLASRPDSPHIGAPAMDDPELGKVAVTGDARAPIATYAETVGALNNAYRASQFAPADVLNRVPGAGAGHSASQDAVIAQMMGKPSSVSGPSYAVSSSHQLGQLYRGTPTGAPNTSMIGAQGRAANANAPAPIRGLDAISFPGMPGSGPAAAPAWGDVFNAPALPPNVAAYLAGYSPFGTPASGPETMSGAPRTVAPTPVDPHRATTPVVSQDPHRLSDARSKTRIRELESQLAALGGPVSERPSLQAPDTAALDDSEYGRQVRPGWRNRDQLAGPSSYPHRWDADPFAVDLRPAQGYSYEYKDPSAPGAAPGRHVGPMAQDLERTPAASTVRDTQRGKVVDTPGLTMVNTAAISELQRKLAQLEALGGGQAAPAAYNPSLYPVTR